MRHRFDRQGILAINPQAFFFLFDEPEERDVEEKGNAAVVAIQGPLVHHEHGWWDSYDAILARVEKACASKASTVVLKIDSPGGDVSGMCDTARAMRARCAAAGKKLVAYVEGNACSAAYCLACSAEKIYVADTGLVGSIGVLAPRIDVSAADAAYGHRFEFITSGARKADGHAHKKLSDAELEATQATINSLANVFFDLVSEMRGIDAQAVADLQAGIFHGAQAIGAGLADQVTSFDALLTALASGEEGKTMADEKKTDEPVAGKDIDDARAALEKAAEGEGEDAEKARRALKALDGEKEEEPEEEEEEGAKSARVAAPSVSASTATELAATVSSLGKKVAKLEKEKEAVERREFLASRPDLDAELVKLLETKPLAEVKAIVNAIKVSDAPKPAATAVVASTRGAGQETPANPGIVASSPEYSWMDSAMGLTASAGGIRREGTALVFAQGNEGLTKGAGPKKPAEGTVSK